MFPIGYFFPYSDQSMRNFIFIFTMTTWWVSSSECPWSCTASIRLGLQEIITLVLVYTKPPAIHQYHHLIIPTSLLLELLLLQINWSQLWSSVFIYVSRFQFGGLSCDLNFMMAFRKALVFSLLNFFTVVKVKARMSSCFTFWSWNQKY